MTSRREFLRTIILGSGAVYAASLGACDRPRTVMKIAPPQRTIRTAAQRFQDAHDYLRDRRTIAVAAVKRRADVVVIGGGLSGLAATHLLRHEGVDVLMIEHEDMVGGVGRSAALHDVRTPLGSVYFVDRSATMLSLMNAAGVQAIPCPPDAYVRGDITHRDIWSDAGIAAFASSQAERAAFRAFRDDLLTYGDDLPSYPLNGPLPSQWAALDAMPAKTFVDRYGSPLLTSVLDAYSRSSMGAELRETNAYCLLNFYASEFDLGPAPERFTFHGGMHTLTQGVGTSLGSSVASGELVVKVRNTSAGADVISVDAEGRVIVTTTSRVVCAVQKFMVPFMVDGLPSAQSSAMRSLQYAPYMTIHMTTTEPLVEHDVLDTWHLPSSELYTDVINPVTLVDRPTDVHITSVFCPLPRSTRRSLVNDDDVIQRVANTIDAVLTRCAVDASVVRDVYAWTWGHSIVIPTVGSHAGASLTAQAPFGHCYFANTDNDASPSVESAIAAAERAVDGTLRSMAQSRTHHNIGGIT